MNEIVFQGSDLSIRSLLEGWAKAFDRPFDGNEIVFNGDEGKCNIIAKYMPSGLEFALIEFDFLQDYYIELIADPQEGYVLWVDVPHSQNSIDKINSPDFRLIPKLGFIHNKMNFKLPRKAPATGFSFLIYLHPTLLNGLLSGPNWKTIFNWYFNSYITNLDFIKINAIELNIATSLYNEIKCNNNLITTEKYLYQLLELFFLKLEKKFNAIYKKRNLLDIENVYLLKIKELFRSQFKSGEVDKTKIIQDIGLSKYQLDKLLKKVYNLRFNEYHTNEKLAYAGELLKQNTMGVHDIATQIGYADSSSFIEAFKNKYGKTPLEVKKNARKA